MKPFTYNWWEERRMQCMSYKSMSNYFGDYENSRRFSELIKYIDKRIEQAK